MKLVVFSHKVCWPSAASPIGHATDGGFVFHMQAMAGIFNVVNVVVPVDKPAPNGEVPFTHTNISILPVAPIRQKGIYRKLYVPIWLIRHFGKFYNAIKNADAVHAPIPGDIGTIGMLMAHAMGKPLFVRHCGNWMVAKTPAEKFWKWYMIKYAGGKRVFFATGGGEAPPALQNPNLEWIFSSSLSHQTLPENAKRSVPGTHPELRLLIACRQDEQKGTGRVIEALKLLPQTMAISFTVIGEGNSLAQFKQLAEQGKQNHRVKFLGKLSHKDVIAQMKTADVFCYPTRASEGFPKVVLEAMSCGLTIMANPVSVLKTLIPSSQAGILLLNDSAETIAEGIADLYNNRKILQTNAENGCHFAQQFSLEAWANTIRNKMEQAWGRSTLD
ncbi:MAG: glycosyltransferase [Bacteroidetes bacterium]|nr:MAG: glycosyltransferase [Bacteroidota bacterium]